MKVTTLVTLTSMQVTRSFCTLTRHPRPSSPSLKVRGEHPQHGGGGEINSLINLVTVEEVEGLGLLKCHYDLF